MASIHGASIDFGIGIYIGIPCRGVAFMHAICCKERVLMLVLNHRISVF